VDTLTRADPIDQLIPPPRSWRTRLVVGLLIVATVLVVSALIGGGFLYPQPECCGSGNGGAEMTLTTDGTAVTITALFFNSSGRDLTILSASADLPGATVVHISFEPGDDLFAPEQTQQLPAVIGGNKVGQFAITFIPRTCTDEGTAWGSVTVELDVVNRWLPSIDRKYTLPHPVVDQQTNPLSIFPPNNNLIFSTLHTPLAAACALLSSAGR
jgi:hypothetical protein